MNKFVVFVTVIVAALFLTSCSMQALAEKILPENVKTSSIQIVDAIMQKDASVFAEIKNEKMSDEDFTAMLESMFSHVTDGSEIRRDIVGSSSFVNASIGEGTTRTYSVTYEIQTEQGFTVVGLEYMQMAEQETCCALQNVNVQSSDVSPYRIPFAKTAKIAKIAGLIILLALILLVTFLVRNSRRRKST